MSENLTAVEWLRYQLLAECKEPTAEMLDKAIIMEREQHAKTWDAAIKAHDERGHVHARSLTDFDDYIISH